MYLSTTIWPVVTQTHKRWEVAYKQTLYELLFMIGSTALVSFDDILNVNI